MQEPSPTQQIDVIIKIKNLPDSTGFLNTRLDSKTVRATDLAETDELDEAALTELIKLAIPL
jgi:hypothetical protein